MSDNINSPAIADLLIPLSIGHACGVVVGERLKPLRLDRSKLADHIIPIGKIYPIQPRTAALTARLSGQAHGFAVYGVYPLTLRIAADVTYAKIITAYIKISKTR